ncbi:MULTISPECIES: helix-turn-helix domain-containing protein [Myroides]|uniref:HTH araC/xylS-type domain-containing protein n=1 Tax=Myroides odoratimimus CIP 101113 TaxID=883154 RepID=A0AAV3F4J4_9FLAO|nr:MULTISPECIES: AraC family transcriptional regulator [Myroides]AJA70028.1 AraC-type DNA-binding domain-containing protein [Myroides sp. A21]EHO12723.1 hypothetical protein HMPREF9715_01878 [Myroides odoratimimus CIP 101113]EPH12240.1 hypothetical protein HMPREF9713_01081 [Myroides odoratimimus CCUG 12700]MDM1067274.1 helix-turn-helix transcriptional regulator [Myroides odoratimimus]MDM1520556.1 helix-turn-helix transcriptional regulator [Myroides odoratimimus]
MSIKINKERFQAFLEALDDLAKGNYTKRLSSNIENDCFSNAETVFNILAEEYENKFKYFITLQPTLGYEYITSCIIKISPEGRILDMSLIKAKDNILDKIDFIDNYLLDLVSEQDQEKWLKNFLIFLQTPTKRTSFSLELLIKGESIKGYCGFHYMGQSREIWMSFAIVNPIFETEKIEENTPDYTKIREIKFSDKQKIQQIHAILCNKEYDRIYTIDELIEQFQINKNVFQKGFKAMYNQTFYSFYLEQRIKYAKQLLIYSNLSINNIAHKCGFTDYSNFFRNFQKATNHNPAEFRKKYSKGLNTE